MAENFLNLGREMDVQIHEAQRIPNRLNPNRVTLIHIIIKLSGVKDKERILKGARRNREAIYKGTHITLKEDFSTETFSPGENGMK